MFDDYKSENISTNAGTDSYPGYVLPHCNNKKDLY